MNYLNEFLELEDNDSKYEYLISLAKSNPNLNSKYKNSENLIRECQNKVWLIAGFDETNKLFINYESESRLVGGILFLIKEKLENKSKSEVLKIIHNSPTWLEEIFPKELISIGKQRGVRAFLTRIKEKLGEVEN